MQLYQSNRTPKYIDEFTRYAMVYLGLDKLRGDITITLKPQLEAESYGLCWGDRQECEIHIASTSFGVKVSREHKLKTVAHELTHAYQYLTGKLKCDPTCNEEHEMWKSTWEGKVYRYKPENESKKPWELEAVRFENEVYYSYLEDKSLYK